jgi:hypothetical protein
VSARRYNLTKSRFKTALECPTKLYYAGKQSDYYNRTQDDVFLAGLAKGGHQVGELAKYLFHDDPVGAAITVNTLNSDEALAETNQRLTAGGRVVIAEAALQHEHYFVRIDILNVDHNAQTVEVIEVKSKSVTESDIAEEFPGTSWRKYLYDIAFQTEVARHAFPAYEVHPKLVLIDKERPCTINGLHQMFKLVRVRSSEGRARRFEVQTEPGLTRAQLGDISVLRIEDVTDAVKKLRNTAVGNDAHIPAEHGGDLPTFMAWAAQVSASGERYFHGVSNACKKCEFRAPSNQPSQKSGVHECWALAIEQRHLVGDSDPTDRRIPLAIDLWSPPKELLKTRSAFLKDLQAHEIEPKASNATQVKRGFSRIDRQAAQIRCAAEGTPYLLEEAGLSEMDTWQWPLHMIDFETSKPALPFTAGKRAYSTLAFQFSHHIMERSEDGSVHVRHANQWISTAPGSDPNLDFVRALKRALAPNGVVNGTVFRYSHHENTVLREIHRYLESDAAAIPDAHELMSFIHSITRPTSTEVSIGAQPGEKAMVDLCDVVQRGYYSSRAGGSNSIKYILPAILRDAPDTAALYSKPGVYGAGLAIHSMNFTDANGHVWLQDGTDNPYASLPPIQAQLGPELDAMLATMCTDEDELREMTIGEGGVAMLAYNLTQFTDLTEAGRNAIRDALLRYCELDTLAMVIVVQGLMELRNQPTNTRVHPQPILS